jgi:uncharacterized protein
METPIAVDLGRIAQDLQIRRVQVENVVTLLDEGHTIPFIARYRRDRSSGLREPILREIAHRVRKQRDFAERKQAILKSIAEQGKLNDELEAELRSTEHPRRLEDLYLPYKPKKRTQAIEARERGLEPLALRIWNRDETLIDLGNAALEFVNAEVPGNENVEKVLDGVAAILAESISELAMVRDAMRRVVHRSGRVVVSKAEHAAEAAGHEYKEYFNVSESAGQIPPHRLATILRGEKEGVLKIRFDIPRPDLERALFHQLPLEGHPQSEYFTKAAMRALEKLLVPNFEREMRRELSEMAEKHTAEVLSRQLRNMLMQPPVPGHVVLSIDPGFRGGCRVAVLDPDGKLLETATIQPHQPQNRRHEAKVVLKDLVAKHGVTLVAIGNGTACRETEELIADMIAEGTHFHTNPGVPFPVKTRAHTPGGERAPGAEGAPPAEHEPASGAEETSSEGAPMDMASESEAVVDSPPASEAQEPAPDPVVEEKQVEDAPPVAGGSTEEEAAHGEDSNPPEDAAPEPTDAIQTPAEHGDSEPVPAVIESVAVDAADAVVADTTEPVSGDAAADAPEAPAGSNGETPESGIAAEAPATTAEAPKGTKPPTPAPDLLRPPKGTKTEPAPKPIKIRQPPPPPEPHTADPQLATLSYVIVNEAGASAYASSPLGRDELPDSDGPTRCAVSLGRRIQDPIAELSKIEPSQLAVGVHAIDPNSKSLKPYLEDTVETCVNRVGVDLNKATASSLRFISGLNPILAARVVERRATQGPFTKREQLTEIEGITPDVYKLMAGFVRVRGGENPLDATVIHPESYELAGKLLELIGESLDLSAPGAERAGWAEKFGALDLATIAKEASISEPSIHDLCDALIAGDWDPRADYPTPLFKRGVLRLDDLEPGAELRGTVLNVVEFGAFVDVGLKDSGLVHISQLANRYVKSPHDVVSVGDVVVVWVLAIDRERKRVSLTMVQPGTERSRGPGEGPEVARAPRGERRPSPGRGPGPRSGGGGQRGGRPQGAPSDQPPKPPEKTVNMRIPGPPQRSQNRDRGGRRGGPQRGGQNQGPGDRAGSDASRAAARPKPTPPEQRPLPPDALTGTVPLRTFGQLKQLFEARTKPEDDDAQAETAGSDDATSRPGSEDSPPSQ